MIAWILRGIVAFELSVAALVGLYLAVHYGFLLSIPGAFALGLFMVLLWHPIIIAVDFLFARIAGDPVPPEFQLSPWRAIAAFDVELDASLRSFTWAQPFLAWKKAPAPTEPAKPLPVLFVHGYFCNRAIWLPFMREAAQRGYLCEAVNLEPPFGSIDNYADGIEHAVGDLAARASTKDVLLVCHSMGGLAVRAWMRKYGHERARRVVTLGTPHRGTFHAGFASGRNAEQMQQGSLWIAELESTESPERRALFTCIFSHHDNIVAPHLTAFLEGAKPIPMGGLGHVQLVYSRRVWGVVFEELAKCEATDAVSVTLAIAAQSPAATA